ncbi:f-box only protein [Anaeramoeba flamelloides]|uniref:F-box only protein n=1 Tax=Anaeramoeba flamelloides TaxID=1746091 RepID=A0ABQ8XGC4_9EUKA|nr:f-box only protein [Anaeramoeba flamelloides]
MANLEESYIRLLTSSELDSSSSTEININKEDHYRDLSIQEIHHEIERSDYFIWHGQTCLRIQDLATTFDNGKYLPATKKQASFHGKEKSLHFADLPIEILWMILEYLPPKKLGMMRVLNRNINQATQDKDVWRQACLNYNELFIWDRLEFNRFFLSSKSKDVYGILSDLKFKKTGKIAKRFISNDNSTIQIRQRMNKDIIPVTNRRMRYHYIKELPNPEKAIKKKFEKNRQILKLYNQSIKKIEETKVELEKKKKFQISFLKSIAFLTLISPVFLITSQFLLNLFVKEKPKKLSLFWVLFPLIIFILIFLSNVLIHLIKFSVLNLYDNMDVGVLFPHFMLLRFDLNENE